MKAKIVLLVIVVFFFVSCDPPHGIVFINESGADASVTIKLKQDASDYDLKELAKGDSIVFNLKQGEKASIDFGIGQWSDSTIDREVRDIQSLKIESQNKETVYRSSTSIRELLIEHRTGRFITDHDINIEIE